MYTSIMHVRERRRMDQFATASVLWSKIRQEKAQEQQMTIIDNGCQFFVKRNLAVFSGGNGLWSVLVLPSQSNLIFMHF